MEAKELMIGNLVERDGNILEVIRISKDFINCETLIISKGLKTNSGRIIPIKITQEWLVKLGFTTENKPNGDIEYFYKGYRYNLIKKENYDGYYFCDGNIVLRDLEYIHELQNIYFVLIGTELKLNNDKNRIPSYLLQ